MPVLTGAAQYPEGLEEKMRSSGATVDELDALGLAMQAGSAKSSNIALMGRFSNYYKDISEEEWLSALADCVKPQFLEMNRKAFELGKNA